MVHRSFDKFAQAIHHDVANLPLHQGKSWCSELDADGRRRDVAAHGVTSSIGTLLLGALSPAVFVPAAGVLALMVAVSSLVFGLSFSATQALSVACAMFGASVFSYSWHTSASAADARPLEFAARLAYSFFGGSAIQFNLAWLLRSFDIPVDLLLLTGAHVFQASCVSLALIAYAGACYLLMVLCRIGRPTDNP